MNHGHEKPRLHLHFKLFAHVAYLHMCCIYAAYLLHICRKYAYLAPPRLCGVFIWLRVATAVPLAETSIT